MKVSIIGQGYVGLSLAISAAKAGHEVVGFDVNSDLVSQLAAGKSHVEGVELAGIGNYKATSDAAAIDGAEVVIISLGSNDHKGVKTYNELYKLRERIKAQRVYWVLPNPEKFPKQAEDVKLISVTFGDFVITPTRYQADKVHPSWAGYKEIADEAK